MKNVKVFFSFIVVFFCLINCSLITLAKTNATNRVTPVITREEAMKTLEGKANETIGQGWCTDLFWSYVQLIYNEVPSNYYVNACDLAKINDQYFSFVPFNGQDFTNFERGDVLVYSYSAYANINGVQCGHVCIIDNVVDEKTLQTVEQHYHGPYTEIVISSLEGMKTWSEIAGCLRPNYDLIDAKKYEKEAKKAEDNLKRNAKKETMTLFSDIASCAINIANMFLDVDNDQYYTKSVEYVANAGYMTGISTTQFNPKGMLYREDFATILFNVEGRPSVTATTEFEDVQNDQYYTEAVYWLEKNKLSSGISEHKFGVQYAITREQMIVVLFRYAKMKGLDTTVSSDYLWSYPDKDKISSYAMEAVNWSVAKGIISGKPGNNGELFLDPQGKATRAEVAKLIEGFAKL